MSSYQTLLHLAFPAPADAAHYLTPAVLAAADDFGQATAGQQPFRFERWRLGVALALLRLLADLGDHDEARRAADVLHRALTTARSPHDIDQQVGRENKLFEQVYSNLYVNEAGETLLNLFARTLDADAPALLAAVEAEAVALAEGLELE